MTVDPLKTSLCTFTSCISLLNWPAVRCIVNEGRGNVTRITNWCYMNDGMRRHREKFNCNHARRVFRKVLACAQFSFSRCCFALLDLFAVRGGRRSRRQRGWAGSRWKMLLVQLLDAPRHERRHARLTWETITPARSEEPEDEMCSVEKLLGEVDVARPQRFAEDI